MSKRTEQRSDNGGDQTQSASHVDCYFHSTPYAMTGRELWTGLLAFFITGAFFGALGVVIISHLK